MTHLNVRHILNLSGDVRGLRHCCAIALKAAYVLMHGCPDLVWPDCGNDHHAECACFFEQKEADANRDLSAVRFRHAESLRQEMESMRGRLRTAEDDVARKGALISHNNHQVGSLSCSSSV